MTPSYTLHKLVKKVTKKIAGVATAKHNWKKKIEVAIVSIFVQIKFTFTRL